MFFRSSHRPWVAIDCDLLLVAELVLMNVPLDSYLCLLNDFNILDFLSRTNSKICLPNNKKQSCKTIWYHTRACRRYNGRIVVVIHHGLICITRNGIQSFEIVFLQCFLQNIPKCHFKPISRFFSYRYYRP